jgi:hypothetical protein
MKHHLTTLLILIDFIAFGLVALFAVGSLVLAMETFSR